MADSTQWEYMTLSMWAMQHPQWPTPPPADRDERSRMMAAKRQADRDHWAASLAALGDAGWEAVGQITIHLDSASSEQALLLKRPKKIRAFDGEAGV